MTRLNRGQPFGTASRKAPGVYGLPGEMCLWSQKRRIVTVATLVKSGFNQMTVRRAGKTLDVNYAQILAGMAAVSVLFQTSHQKIADGMSLPKIKPRIEAVAVG